MGERNYAEKNRELMDQEVKRSKILFEKIKNHPIEVDPNSCKPWKYHNRDTAWLTPHLCKDLISSIQKHGQNEPALLRRTEEGSHYDYEIIYGVRRWFACSQIKNQKLWGYVTQMDDKACALLMHIENADSRDISEFERAFSFSQQLKSNLFKNQTELAEAMGITQGTVSKMLSAVEIFDYPWIRELFSNKLDIPVKYAYHLSVLLKNTNNHTMIKAIASSIQEESQKVNAILSGKQILKRLIDDGKPNIPSAFQSFLSQGNKPIVSCRRDKFGKVSIIIESEAKDLSRDKIEAACAKAISEYIFD